MIGSKGQAGDTSPEVYTPEKAALAQAILSYLEKNEPEDVSPFTKFLVEYPRSCWRVSLLTNLGVVYRHTGYFLKALGAWEEAWKLGKLENEAEARLIVDKAVGELAELNARLGRYGRLERLLAEVSNRDVHGPATEKLTGAREGLSVMRNEPGVAFRCGPMALDRIRAAANPADAFDPKIVNRLSTRRGTSLVALATLASDLNMNYQMAYRRAGADVITPAIVHWKAGHFAALTKAASIEAQQKKRLVESSDPSAISNPRYFVQDPTFGADIWVSQKALDAEASGYFLVEKGKLPSGWRAVTTREGRAIWGKGQTTAFDTEFQGSCDPKAKPGCDGCGMAEYNIHASLVALNIVDTPVGYTPPRGPAVNFTVTYNQRDAFQPAVFSYWNLGAKWTSDWLSYVTDDPSNPNADAKLYLRGGGQETYTTFNPGTQQYATQMRSRSVLVRTSPTSYERRMPDGSKQVFVQPDGAATFPRKVFMTQIVDSMGNAVNLTYDASLRLTAITDAIGQVTTLLYEDPFRPLRLTKVIDPFGRFATFEYMNVNGTLLSKITDVIGLQSQFATIPGSGDFIREMTTPYGTTFFTFFANPNDATNRWITVTKPLGQAEKVEFRHLAPGISSTDPVNTVPTGMGTHNDLLQFRNTFYWDPEAWAQDSSDYTKAKLTHWLHSTSTSMSSGIMESEKNALERRVWYNYPGQGDTAFLGNSASVSRIGRVLDDGTTQLFQYEYNDQGNATQQIDPSGRRMNYTYASNGIDLLELRQTTGSANDLLAKYTYNTQHEPLTIADAARQTTVYAYNTQGQVQTVTNAKSEQTTYSYTNGYLMSLTGPVTGATIGYTYDGFGRVRTVTDSDAYVVTTDYDALDRPTVTTYPDATFQQITYDKLDVSQTRDRLARVTQIVHDALRRVTSITDPLMRQTTFDWCLCGGLHQMIDALQHATIWNRDLQGRVTSKMLADNTHADYVYETTTSRLKQMTDAKGQTTNYQYFGDDNLKQVSYTNAMIATQTVNYTYDPIYNRVATMADGTGASTYTYHPVVAAPSPPQLGATQLASVDGPLGNDTITYSYDELGRVLNRAINAVSSSQSYDALGRVTVVTNPLGVFSYLYDGVTSRLTNIATTNNGEPIFQMSYTYYVNTGDRRLKTITNTGSQEGALSSFLYTYSAEGEIGKIKRTLPPVTEDGHGYDLADQLTIVLRTSDRRDAQVL